MTEVFENVGEISDVEYNGAITSSFFSGDTNNEGHKSTVSKHTICHCDAF